MIGDIEFGRSKTGEAECAGRFMLLLRGKVESTWCSFNFDLRDFENWWQAIMKFLESFLLLYFLKDVV